MVFNYKKEEFTPMTLILENGVCVKGEFIDLRINQDTIPEGQQWYQIRYCDDDDTEPASLKRGCVVVNFLGTFICEPIEDMEDGMELEISEWDWC